MLAPTITWETLTATDLLEAAAQDKLTLACQVYLVAHDSGEGFYGCAVGELSLLVKRDQPEDALESPYDLLEYPYYHIARVAAGRFPRPYIHGLDDGFERLGNHTLTVNDDEAIAQLSEHFKNAHDKELYARGYRVGSELRTLSHAVPYVEPRDDDDDDLLDDDDDYDE